MMAAAKKPCWVFRVLEPTPVQAPVLRRGMLSVLHRSTAELIREETQLKPRAEGANRFPLLTHMKTCTPPHAGVSVSKFALTIENESGRSCRAEQMPFPMQAQSFSKPDTKFVQAALQVGPCFSGQMSLSSTCPRCWGRVPSWVAP